VIQVGYTASLFTELYLYQKGIILNSSAIYSNGLDLGYDYQANTDVVSFINSVTGAEDAVHPEIIEQTLTDGESSYKSYFWPHRAGESDLWFNVGQVLGAHCEAVQAAGYQSVISFRDDGEPTCRIVSDPATGAVNNDEFSDDNGNYNVTAEQLAVTSVGMGFFHLPLTSGGSTTWTAAQFEQYLPVMLEAEARGPVLAHCASGYRSAAYVLAYLASKSGYCTDWALRQSALIGLVYDGAQQSSTDKQVVAFFQQVLQC
jgi:protein tyrosine phosphatase (PTP) superfamily phosphohydrolase (DUF442 family)